MENKFPYVAPVDGMLRRYCIFGRCPSFLLTNLFRHFSTAEGRETTIRAPLQGHQSLAIAALSFAGHTHVSYDCAVRALATMGYLYGFMGDQVSRRIVSFTSIRGVLP